MKSACHIFCILFCCVCSFVVYVNTAISEEHKWENTRKLPAYWTTPSDNSISPKWNSTKDLSTLPNDNENTAGDTETINANPPATASDTTGVANEDYAGVVDINGNAGYGGPREKQKEILYYYPSVRGGNGSRWSFTNDLVLPVYRTDTAALFINPRNTFHNEGEWDFNIGVGYRHLIADSVIVGANTYYDTSRRYYENGQTPKREQRNYGQIGTGVEVLTNWVNFRANGYMHLSGDARTEDYYRFSDLGIRGSGGEVAEALSGFDGEVGFKIPGLSNYVETWVYGGGYTFVGDSINRVNGYKARLEIVPAGLVRMSVGYSNDRIDGNQLEGSLALEIPFSVTNLASGKNPFEGMTDRLIGSRTLKERLVEPVSRDIDMRVKTDGTNSSTGLVKEVVFVSENATPGDPTNDGTFEHPYATIDEAMSNARLGTTADTVHVMNDSGTNTAGGGTATIPNILIWGAGINDPIYTNILNKTTGYPSIGNLILNADGVSVAGLNFGLSGGTGITTNAGGTNSHIYSNIFSGTGTGLRLIDATGFRANNNTFNLTGTGIDVVAPLGTSWNYINDNTFNVIGIGISGLGGPVTEYNVFNVTGVGISLTNGYASIFNNTFNIDNSSGDSYGISTNCSTDDIQWYSIAYNVINVSSSGGNAYGVNLNASNGYGIEYSTSILGNTINVTSANNAAGGITINSSGDIIFGDYNGNIDGNTITVNSPLGDASGISLVANGNIEGVLGNNSITVVGGGVNPIYGLLINSISGNFGVHGSDPAWFHDNVINVNSLNSSSYGTRILSPNGFVYAMMNSSGTITGATDAFGIDVQGNNVFTWIVNNMNVNAGNDAYFARITANLQIGPITRFTQNEGSVNGSNANYFLWLSPGWPGASGVEMGTGNPGMGDNSVTTTGTWSGNYGDNNEVQDNSGSGGSYITP